MRGALCNSFATSILSLSSAQCVQNKSLVLGSITQSIKRSREAEGRSEFSSCQEYITQVSATINYNTHARALEHQRLDGRLGAERVHRLTPPRDETISRAAADPISKENDFFQRQTRPISAVKFSATPLALTPAQSILKTLRAHAKSLILAQQYIKLGSKAV